MRFPFSITCLRSAKFAACLISALPAAGGSFFDAGPVAPAALPAGAIYPLGRTMLFAGYSGKPERDLANGFTVAGPFYGDQSQVDPLLAKGIPTFVQLGVSGGVANNSADLDPANVRKVVSAQLDRWADNPHIAFWSVQPEELRSWRKNEVAYLHLVTGMIRKRDKLHRPIYIYQPNNRDAASLESIAAEVDVLGKGSYVNSCGYTGHRGWVRWSIEQTEVAFRLAKKKPFSLIMPELCGDPAPEDVSKIPDWVRHDTYLGLMSGAKGVLVWSLFPRKEVKKTWQIWYDSYAEIGRELTGDRRLGDVFLFGERRHNLEVHPVESRPVYDLQEIKNKEDDARDKGTAKEMPAMPISPWTATEIAYGPDTYLFIANSSEKPTSFRISGIPADAGITGVFDGAGKPMPVVRKPLLAKLAPWEIFAIKIGRR